MVRRAIVSDLPPVPFHLPNEALCITNWLILFQHLSDGHGGDWPSGGLCLPIYTCDRVTGGRDTRVPEIAESSH